MPLDRVPAYEGFREVIVIRVNPAASLPKGSGIVFKENDQIQQIQAVYQSSVAKEIRPYSVGAGRAGGVQIRGRAAPMKQEGTERGWISSSIRTNDPVRAAWPMNGYPVGKLRDNFPPQAGNRFFCKGEDE